MNHKEVREFCEARGIMALAQPTQFTPKIKPDFSFRKEHVVELVGFWCMGEIAMMLRGPSGCGKTALIEQFHAAMNYPLLQPSTHARTEAPDLNGQIIPSEGGFKYVYGLLVQAARHGLSVFLDEYNVMDSSVTTSLNPILEGGKIDIPETGETIFPKEGFRVFAACNPNDKGLGFFGRNEEDASNKERFWVVEFGYPTADQEVPIVSAILKSVFDDSTADSYAQKMVEVANRIRQQYMGESGAADALEVTMSTRTLRRWARGITVFGGQGGAANPITFTLARALTNNAPRESRDAIHEIVKDIFGATA